MPNVFSSDEFAGLHRKRTMESGLDWQARVIAHIGETNPAGGVSRRAALTAMKSMERTVI